MSVDPASPPGSPKRSFGRNALRRLKLAAFSLLPTVLLLGTAELALRLIPSTRILVAGVEEVYEDRELFWRLKPNLDTAWKSGQRLRTNRLGLRDDEVGLKPAGEYRILCLGESTTYGAFVEVEDTYSQVAERRLNAQGQRKRVRLINGGVPAYTSFQSLVYLKRYGLALQPDAVVLYHEGNDYLPCGWGDVAGRGETDPECYQRLQARAWIWPLTQLHIVKVPSSWFVGRGPAPYMVAEAWRNFGNRVRGMPARLTPQQQWAVLEEFERVCSQAGVHLLFIHPTYRPTRRHTCPLREFSRERKVPMLETLDLYPIRDGRPVPDYFVDECHPSPEGHRRIGEALAGFLEGQAWFPE